MLPRDLASGKHTIAEKALYSIGRSGVGIAARSVPSLVPYAIS